MKLSASRIERMLEKIEALAPQAPRYLRNWRAGRVLSIVHEGSDEAETAQWEREAQEKALAEHIAAHPEHAGYTVEDFFWIVWEILKPPASGRYLSTTSEDEQDLTSEDEQDLDADADQKG